MIDSFSEQELFLCLRAMAELIDSQGWRVLTREIQAIREMADITLHTASPDDVVTISRQQTTCRVLAEILAMPREIQDACERRLQTYADDE